MNCTCPCGGGSSGGGSGSNISVSCCGSQNLPSTITLEIVSGTRTCECLPDFATLTWSETNSQWESGSISGCSSNIEFYMYCPPNSPNCSSMALTISGEGQFLPDFCSCATFTFEYHVALNNICLGGAHITATGGGQGLHLKRKVRSRPNLISNLTAQNMKLRQVRKPKFFL